MFTALDNCHWIGLLIEEIKKEDRIPLSHVDKRLGARLWEELQEASWTGSALLRSQLQLMACHGVKGEMESVIGRIWRQDVLVEKLVHKMRSAGLSWAKVGKNRM